MKKILMILAIVFIVGLIGSIFISESINANEAAPGAKDPHSHIGAATLCYNQLEKACDG